MGKKNETSLPEKEDFCSHLNMEDMTDDDDDDDALFLWYSWTMKGV